MKGVIPIAINIMMMRRADHGVPRGFAHRAQWQRRHNVPLAIAMMLYAGAPKTL